MRFFYDTEFVQARLGVPLVLVSIGVVAEDGREYFACNAEFEPTQADAWVRGHVLPKLPPRPGPAWKAPGLLAEEIRGFFGAAPPELWGYCAAYDHVLLTQLLGGFDRWPEGWPIYTRDIRQWQEALGIKSIPVAWPDEHDALADARWCLEAWKWLNSNMQKC